MVKLRIVAIAAVVAPVLAIGLPIQAALIRLAPRLAGLIPVAFHRLLRLLIGLRVTTQGTPARGGPVLIVANHVSWLDIVALGSLGPLSFIAKAEIAGWPVVGLLAKAQRSIFVDRGRRAATASVNRDIAQRLAAGEAIVLFPEGTTGDGNRVLPFRSALLGAVRDAIAEADHDAHPVLVQPVSIAYTRIAGLPVGRTQRPALAWYGDMDLAPHLFGFLRLPGVDARVTFGEPIAAIRGADRKILAGAMEAAVRRMTHEAANGPRSRGIAAPNPGAEPVDEPGEGVLLTLPPKV